MEAAESKVLSGLGQPALACRWLAASVAAGWVQAAGCSREEKTRGWGAQTRSTAAQTTRSHARAPRPRPNDMHDG